MAHRPAQLNQWRQTLTEPFIRLRQALRGTVPGREFAGFLENVRARALDKTAVVGERMKRAS